MFEKGEFKVDVDVYPCDPYSLVAHLDRLLFGAKGLRRHRMRERHSCGNW